MDKSRKVWGLKCWGLFGTVEDCGRKSFWIFGFEFKLRWGTLNQVDFSKFELILP